MSEYRLSAAVANDALNKCDELCQTGMDDEYVRGVKDALGWLLGFYDPPDCFD